MTPSIIPLAPRRPDLGRTAGKEMPGFGKKKQTSFRGRSTISFNIRVVRSYTRTPIHTYILPGTNRNIGAGFSIHPRGKIRNQTAMQRSSRNGLSLNSISSAVHPRYNALQGTCENVHNNESSSYRGAFIRKVRYL